MKIIKQLFLLAASFIFVLILAECFIKNAKISEVSFADYYEDIGKGLAPQGTYVFFNEGFGISSTNSSRFIGKNVPFIKDTNTIRVALIGDSYVEAIQIFERHYFGNIAENILNERFKQKNKKIEILNFGRSNFNIGNMYAYQKLFIDQFNPDYTLYFLSSNDLVCDYSFPPLLPITTIEKDKLTTTVNADQNELNSYQNTKFLTQKFAFANILNFCRKKIRDKETLPILLDKLYPKPASQNSIVPAGVEEEYVMDSITQKIINTMDSRTILVNRESYALPLNFKNLCIANDLIYLELSPTYKELSESGFIYNKWNVTKKTGHWTSQTHKAIGIEIADNMSDIIGGQ